MECLSTLEGGKIFTKLDDSFKSELTKLVNTVSISESDNVLLNKKLCSLIGFAIRGASELDSAISFLNTIALKESDHPKIAQKASNILWMLGTQLEVGSKSWELLCSFVNRLATDNIIHASTLTTSLDINLLTCAGLLGSSNIDEKRISQKLVKINTNIMYRQQKYNMLEEEMEGYSKLIVLASTLPAYPADISAQVHQFLSIIGLMDLDPNRVLDILLDAFEKSTWNLSFISLLNKLNYSKRFISDIVGMKLSHYHTTKKTATLEQEKDGPADTAKIVPMDEEGEDNADKSQHDESFPHPDLLLNEMQSPAQLYGLVAVLISSNILTIQDVLPFLEPNLQSMIGQYQRQKLDRKEAVRNVPTISLGASIGDIEQPSKTELMETLNSDHESVKPEWVSSGHDVTAAFAEGEQIIGVLSALLAIRCWDAAEVLINIFEAEGIDPFRVESARNALSDLISWVITNVYADNSSFKKYELTTQGIEKNVSALNSKAIPFEAIPQTANQIDMLPANVTALRDFPVLMAKFLFRMKHHLAFYPVLFQKLCRILQRHMCSLSLNGISSISDEEVVSQKVTMYQPTISIITKVLLPSLTCVTSSDPSYLLSRQAWEVVKFLPYQVRFDIYGIWLGTGIGKLGLNDINKSIDCCHAEMVASQHIRALLKRITADNAKVIGKKLARYFPTCPLVVYDYLIKHVCAYENLIPIIIDSMKYASELGFDCMAYCLVRKLRQSVAAGSSAEPKMKEEDTNVTQWFANICKFTATFYMKYPTTELKALFDYILQQCSHGNAVDLLLLKDLLNVMGGCDSIVEVSPQQLEGLSGGRTLRNEMMKGSSGDGASLTKSRALLREALFTSDSAFPLLLTVAQIRQSLLHSKDIKSLKLLSHLHDTSHDFFMQYTDYLVGSDVLFLQKIEKSIPAISTLLVDFNLHISIVFQLIRPLVRSALAYGKDPRKCPAWLQSWHPFSKNMKQAFGQTLQYIACKNFMSHELFIMFWSLSLYDLEVPKHKYEHEISRLIKSKSDLEKQVRTVKMLPVAAKIAHEDIKKNDKLVKALQEEKKIQEEHVATIKTVMQEISTAFFSNVEPANQKNATHALLQHCVYPRMGLSPVDSVYSVRFFYSLHQQRVSGFSTILFADRMLATLPPLIFQSTEGEASCVGYAIDSLLQILSVWFKSEADYNANAFGSPGFCVDGVPTDFYSHSQYKSWCHDWHDNMVTVVTSCLASPEYIHIRSGLVFLNKVAEQFPIWEDGALILQKSIEHIEKTEKDRNDLRLMSLSLKYILAKRSSNWLDVYGKTCKVTKKVVAAITRSEKAVETAPDKDAFDESAPEKESRKSRGVKRTHEGREATDAAPVLDQEDQKQKEREARNRILASKAKTSSTRDERRSDNVRSNAGYRSTVSGNVGDTVRNDRGNVGERGVSTFREAIDFRPNRDNDNGRDQDRRVPQRDNRDFRDQDRPPISRDNRDARPPPNRDSASLPRDDRPRDTRDGRPFQGRDDRPPNTRGDREVRNNRNIRDNRDLRGEGGWDNHDNRDGREKRDHRDQRPINNRLDTRDGFRNDQREGRFEQQGDFRRGDSFHQGDPNFRRDGFDSRGPVNRL